MPNPSGDLAARLSNARNDNNNRNNRCIDVPKNTSSLIKTKTVNSIQNFIWSSKNTSPFSSPWEDHESNNEMDLNRDLPPLPPKTLTRNSSSRSSDRQYSAHSKSIDGSGRENLRPFHYHPARDGREYSGIQYQADGNYYHPEVNQHPSRTSSMAASAGPFERDVEALCGKSQTRATPNTTSPARGSLSPVTPSPGHDIDASSLIMGNFVPLKAVDVSRMNRGGPNTHQKKTPGSTAKTAIVNMNSVEITEARNRRLVPTQPKDSFEDVFLQDSKAGIKDVEYSQQSYPKELSNPLTKLPFLPRNIAAQHSDCDPRRFVGYYVGEHASEDVEDCCDEGQNILHFTAEDYSEFGNGNPFEPSLEGSKHAPDRTTTFTDFLSGLNSQNSPVAKSNPGKRGHMKNSHSESNALYMAKRPQREESNGSKAPRSTLQRSDSARGIPPAATIENYHAGADIIPSSNGATENLNLQNAANSTVENSLHRNPSRGRGFSRPSTRQLEDVPEKGEDCLGRQVQVQKRSRSPIKKIFGGGSWKSGTNDLRQDDSVGNKKPGLVNKIMLKLEEIGLKADISPSKNVKRDSEKVVQPSTFPVSLNPAQQAELYFDIELIICDTANTFLMNEYQNCRMSVDSLQKVTEFWKSKGRPQVVEFHYDQSTQRDLIVANQKTFHFYGPNANNPLHVHGMLYAWKSDARDMAVRTFCYPDSMIRKHIQDAFIILDFLGGHPLKYIALHEAQGKMVRWNTEGQVQMSARSSASSNNQKAEPRSTDSSAGFVIDNPWGAVNKPTPRQI